MEKFLKTASVVVTGYSGYVGTATSEALKEKGYTVIGFDKQDRNDTRNIFKLFHICLKKPNAIIHLSAKKSIPESIKNPTSYYLNNLISTLVVGITSRILNIPVVFASSAAIYSATNPYAKSKLLEEQILNLLCKKVAVLRYFNIVGKTETIYDNESTNIFSIIGRSKIININSPKSTRDYVNVLDIAKANVLAMEYLQDNKSLTTDIFTGNQKTMLDVIEEYKQNGSNISYTILDLPDNTIVSKIDNRDILGWIPGISFSESILSEIKYK
jgi:UDP-glucose 4-epimerase